MLHTDLFKLCEQKNITLFQVKCGEIQLSFTRWLVDNLKSDWDKVLADVSQYHFKHGEDFVKWKFGNKGSFSVQSVCNAMTTNQNGPMFKNIWKGKNPAKIKFFMWLVLTCHLGGGSMVAVMRS